MGQCRFHTDNPCHNFEMCNNNVRSYLRLSQTFGVKVNIGVCDFFVVIFFFCVWFCLEFSLCRENFPRGTRLSIGVRMRFDDRCPVTARYVNRPTRQKGPRCDDDDSDDDGGGG